MKTLITKSDGTPTKSKVHALQFLEKNGIPKELLIEENGQFFYAVAGALTESKAQSDEGVNEGITLKTLQNDNEILKQVQNDNENVDIPIADEKPIAVDVTDSIFKPVVWDTPIYDKNNNKTKLVVIGTDVVATINGKHPAGQNRSVSAFELNIGNENFIMSLYLISRLFKVMEG